MKVWWEAEAEADTIKVGKRLTDDGMMGKSKKCAVSNSRLDLKVFGMSSQGRKKLVPWLVGTNKPNDSTGKHATRGNCSKIMVFQNWSGVTRRVDWQHPDAETGRPRTRPKHTTRLSGEFPPCRVSPRAEDRGGHRLQVELVLHSTPTPHVPAMSSSFGPRKAARR
ncbi:uncharacterized protein CLUP02_10409 [Colletotrichum lupini]|uniref:Uncharacterized protein n=1 Tax=Colletotrichum lupini TaxID=145971 RepID=A0A9Q8SWQ7_9PEZI|nr:uncharacterized protein CLUP02_10409 [Colletotrichum lupini]UQC84913.1 hypothetical protein CLUP02_10409 [Colletotrichum lupini]